MKIIPPKLVFFRDSRGDWRWRIVARNRRILAASSEGFTRRRDARRNLRKVRRALRLIDP